MSKTFTTYCDEFFAQDTPFDAGSLEAIADNQKAIWDETGSVVAKGFTYQSGDALNEFQEWGSTVDRCMFVRPYLLTPGLKEIKIRIYGQAFHWSDDPGSEAVETAVFFRAGEGVTSSISAQIVPVLETGTDAYMDITIPVRQVAVPEMTLIQLWMSSSFEPISSPQINVDELTLTELVPTLQYDSPPDFTWTYSTGANIPNVKAPATLFTNPTRWAIGWWAKARNLLIDVQTVVWARENGPGALAPGFRKDAAVTLCHRPTINMPEGLSTVTIGPDDYKQVYYGLAEVSYYQVKAIAFQEIREDSSTYLDTTPEEFYTPGNLTEAQCVSGFVGADVSNRDRPENVLMAIGDDSGAVFKRGSAKSYTRPVMLKDSHRNFELHYILNRLPIGETDAGLQERVELKFEVISNDSSVLDTNALEYQFGTTSTGRGEASTFVLGDYAGESGEIQVRDWGYSSGEVDRMFAHGPNFKFGRLAGFVPSTTSIPDYGDGVFKPIEIRVTLSPVDGDDLLNTYSLYATLVAKPE